MNSQQAKDETMADRPDDSAVRSVLRQVLDPETGRDVISTGQVHSLETSSGSIRVGLGVTSHSAPLSQDVIQQAEQILRTAFPGVGDIKVILKDHTRPPEKIGQIGLPAKSVIAVGSGKGGVGKSTVAAALVYALHRAGSIVGLVDADVYGPSIPHLLGMKGRPVVIDNKIQPMEKDGIEVMSMGFLVPPGEAVVWRGPMLHQAITQFLRDTRWSDLDYLVIDMPPGTGDIALTLSQILPLSGAVVVCTPQEVALLDAVKAIAMFRKVQIPVLGMVENMSGFVCPDCHKKYDIFGSGGAKKKAAELGVPFLGEIPIHMHIRERGDEGQTGAIFDDPVVGPYVIKLTYNLAKNLADRARAQPPLPTLSVL
jgi:ATP-binding protein involved in chromosome partitioning